ncbi:MAG: hypothetical protein AB7U31_03720 [Synergistaceae bacterium]|jgi:hypothetical protein
MIPAFKTHKIRIYRLVEDSSSTYYNEGEDALQLVAEVEGDFQRMGDREKLQEYGDKEISLYRLFLPADVDIRYDDRVKVDGYDFTLRVSSQPHHYKLLNYQRVTLQRQEENKPSRML